MNKFMNSVGKFHPGFDFPVPIVGSDPDLTGFIDLGTDDGFFTIKDENAEVRSITYNGFYAVLNETSRKSNITSLNPPDRRASAELYLTKLVEEMGGIASFSKMPNGDNEFIHVPHPNSTPGTLFNPYTFNDTPSGDLSFFQNCFLTRADFSDEGRWFYGFVLTFQQLKTPIKKPNETPALIMYKGNPVGNFGGFWNVSDITPTSVTYSTTSYYSGPNPGSYLAILADTLGLDPLESVELPFASAGNRTAYLSCTNTPGPLVRNIIDGGTVVVAETETGMYLTSLSGRLRDTGILTINAEFEKAR